MFERRSNDFVVIELRKRDKGPIEQQLRYLQEVDERLVCLEPQPARGKRMIITGQPNASLEESLAERITDYPVTWYLYRVKLQLDRRSEATV